MESRVFVIFDVSELDKIDFSQVLETSADTVRKSVNGKKTFVKWEGDAPTCVVNLTTKTDFLTLEEILAVLDTPEWTSPVQI